MVAAATGLSVNASIAAGFNGSPNEYELFYLFVATASAIAACLTFKTFVQFV